MGAVQVPHTGKEKAARTFLSEQQVGVGRPRLRRRESDLRMLKALPITIIIGALIALYVIAFAVWVVR